ncbi:MAG: hypothetical protein FJ276_15685, partial [Planctomycetes bacterium]|nr:hypothetical protein [Planctomycetota bacterium]
MACEPNKAAPSPNCAARDVPLPSRTEDRFMRSLLAQPLVLCGLCLSWAGGPAVALGQETVADFLRRLDGNADGWIDPDEILDDARAELETYAAAGGLQLADGVSVEELQRAASVYFEQLVQARSRRVALPPVRGPETGEPAPVRGFAEDGTLPIVPGFGTDATTEYAVTKQDLEEAARRLARDDKNQDAVIDREEARNTRWFENDPFVYDSNKDGRLSLRELAQRYAKRRAAEERDGTGGPPTTERSPSRSEGSRDNPRQRNEPPRDWRGGGPQESRPEDRGVWYLARTVIDRYDADRSGELEQSEWRGLGRNATRADTNRNGRIDVRELATWLHSQEQKQAGAGTLGLPDWFHDRDLNSDGQVALSEFADELTDAKIAEFRVHDLNGDGFITSSEYLDSLRTLSGTFRNDSAMVIPRGGIAVSEINVDSEDVIADLDVQLSITHTSVNQLDAFLIGPDGQRIELFTQVGGTDDHFNSTILDDEADQRIVEGRPPFHGRYQPEACTKQQPSLAHFYGKPAKGVWQLMIRSTKNDRSGVLHGWALIVLPR